MSILNVELTKKKNDLVLLKELEMYLSRGHSMNETIALLKPYFEIDKLEQALLMGEDFSVGLQSLNYTNDIILLIKMNEKNGSLVRGLNEAINLIELKNKNRSQVFNQLRYPLFLLGMIFFVVVFVNQLVLPEILNLYKSFGVDLPLMIIVFLKLLEIIPSLIIILITITFLFFFGTRKISYDIKVKYISKIPFIGKEYRLIYNVSFVSYINSMLKNKLSIRDALEILSEQTENNMLQMEAIRILKQMHDGKLFEECLSSRYYLSEVVHIVKLGCEQNNLIMFLDSYLIKQMAKQNKKKQTMLFLIQPIIYLIIGLIVIIIYGLIFNICYGLIG